MRQVRQTDRELEIVGTKAGVLGDPAEHPGAEFLVVVEGKYDVRHLGMG
jgi:hypothetical protein